MRTTLPVAPAGATPDAWHALVFRSMGVEELTQEINNPEHSAQTRRWMLDELRRKQLGGDR